MNSNTQKFLRTYNEIAELENIEVIGKVARISKEKSMSKLNKDIIKFASKVTEDQFEFLGDLCLNDFKEFKEAYEL